MCICYDSAGERNLYCMTETGQLRFMKKFEHDVSCFTPYSSSKLSAIVIHHLRYQHCNGFYRFCLFHFINKINIFHSVHIEGK